MHFGLVKSNFYAICPWDSPLITRMRQISANFLDCRRIFLRKSALIRFFSDIRGESKGERYDNAWELVGSS